MPSISKKIQLLHNYVGAHSFQLLQSTQLKNAVGNNVSQHDCIITLGVHVHFAFECSAVIACFEPNITIVKELFVLSSFYSLLSAEIYDERRNRPHKNSPVKYTRIQKEVVLNIPACHCKWLPKTCGSLPRNRAGWDGAYVVWPMTNQGSVNKMRCGPEDGLPSDRRDHKRTNKFVECIPLSFPNEGMEAFNPDCSPLQLFQLLLDECGHLDFISALKKAWGQAESWGRTWVHWI